MIRAPMVLLLMAVLSGLATGFAMAVTPVGAQTRTPCSARGVRRSLAPRCNG